MKNVTMGIYWMVMGVPQLANRKRDMIVTIRFVSSLLLLFLIYRKLIQSLQIQSIIILIVHIVWITRSYFWWQTLIRRENYIFHTKFNSKWRLLSFFKRSYTKFYWKWLLQLFHNLLNSIIENFWIKRNRNTI